MMSCYAELSSSKVRAVTTRWCYMHPSCGGCSGWSARADAGGVEGELEAIADADLAVDLREVRLHGLLADPEVPRDLGVPEALADVAYDLFLARREHLAAGTPKLR